MVDREFFSLHHCGFHRNCETYVDHPEDHLESEEERYRWILLDQ